MTGKKEENAQEAVSSTSAPHTDTLQKATQQKDQDEKMANAQRLANEEELRKKAAGSGPAPASNESRESRTDKDKSSRPDHDGKSPQQRFAEESQDMRTGTAFYHSSSMVKATCYIIDRYIKHLEKMESLSKNCGYAGMPQADYLDRVAMTLRFSAGEMSSILTFIPGGSALRDAVGEAVDFGKENHQRKPFERNKQAKFDELLQKVEQDSQKYGEELKRHGFDPESVAREARQIADNEEARITQRARATGRSLDDAAVEDFPTAKANAGLANAQAGADRFAALADSRARSNHQQGMKNVFNEIRQRGAGDGPAQEQQQGFNPTPAPGRGNGDR